MEALIEPAVIVPGLSVRVAVDEQSQIGEARRIAATLGHAHGLSAEAAGRLAIVVTEAATNIVIHAGRGVIVLRGLVAGATAALEVLALDKGPGIPDVERAMRDGYSTSGTAGQGLGGMRRLADVFEIYSHRDGGGTALLARIAERPRAGHARRRDSLDDRVGVVCVPVRGEIECGDAWRVIAGKRRIAVLLVDGLGHGAGAAAAAAVATTTFSRLAGGRPDAALFAMDAAMRATRGAALSMAVLDENARTTAFSGVGNVDGRVLTAGPTEHLVPQNGIVGHTMPSVRTTTASWPGEGRLVLHSDGISSRWRMEAYPGLMKCHPALLAGLIYRDFARDRDDATVVVVANEHLTEQH